MAQKRAVFLYHGRGQIGGEAFYLEYGDNGIRVAGPKCYGIVNPVYTIRMTASDLREMISVCEDAIDYLNHQEKEKAS